MSSEKHVVRQTRIEQSDHGTFSACYIDGETVPSFYLAEPPWRDNEPFESCIPTGGYQVEMDESPHYGHVYHVRNVPRRSDILWHVGNWAGDEKKGMKTNTDGCQLPGMSLGHLEGQRVVLSSGDALSFIYERLGQQPFTLLIQDGFSEDDEFNDEIPF